MGQEAAFIIIQGPGHDGTRLSLREGITSFGRLPSNDVILLGDLVSRHHARILYFDGKASIQDLGSHNGSFVNGDRISTRPLGEGDMVRVGNFKITLQVGKIDEDGEVGFTDEATADASQHPLEGVHAEHVSRPEGQARVVRAESRLSGPPATVPLDPDTDQGLPANLGSREAGRSKLVQEISEAEQDPRLSTLQLLYRVTEVLAQTTDARDFTEKVLEFTLDRLQAESAVYFRVRSDRPDPVQAAYINTDGGTQAPFISMGVVRWAIAKTFTVFSRDIKTDPRFSEGGSVSLVPEQVSSLVCAPIISGPRTLGALYLARSLSQPFSEIEVDAVEAICHLVAVGLERLQLRVQNLEEARAREALARFHSPDVVERILGEARNEETVLERRPATVLFCDVRGFTRWAEKASLEVVSDFLNTYVEDVSSVVFKHRGTINKLLGDGIVAVFGAPFSYGDDAARAVNAALEMRSAVDELLEGNVELRNLHVRIGVHTGIVLTGTVGSPRRMDYTVLGETVNTAARIQATAAGRTVLISAATREHLDSSIRTRKVGSQQIRGLDDAFELYEVLGPSDALETESG
jgi:class 3 adenylate cyclase/pSer/pThr/pTyr-binding forkhead associated (FHA) protein